jgi:hypothetical protein
MIIPKEQVDFKIRHLVCSRGFSSLNNATFDMKYLERFDSLVIDPEACRHCIRNM